MNNCIGHELQTDSEKLCTEGPTQRTSNFRCKWLPISTQNQKYSENSRTDNLLLLAVYKPQFVSLYVPARKPSPQITQFPISQFFTYVKFGLCTHKWVNFLLIQYSPTNPTFVKHNFAGNKCTLCSWFELFQTALPKWSTSQLNIELSASGMWLLSIPALPQTGLCFDKAFIGCP